MPNAVSLLMSLFRKKSFIVYIFNVYTHIKTKNIKMNVTLQQMLIIHVKILHRLSILELSRYTSIKINTSKEISQCKANVIFILGYNIYQYEKYFSLYFRNCCKFLMSLYY